MLPGEPVSDAPMELRASERVRHYLLTRFDPPREGESRLPTNKELARALDVSPGTVQSVLRQLAQEGRIRSRRGSGTYLIPERKPIGNEPVRIGISVPMERLQANDGWLQRIGGGMFQAALSEQVILEGVAASSLGTDAMVDELMAKRDHVNALVVFPYTLSLHHAQISEAFEKVGKPLVHLHPPYLGATANFVSSDFFGFGFSLGQALYKAGRRRFLKLTNYHFPMPRVLHHSVSHHLRLQGWMTGIGADAHAECSSTVLPCAESLAELGYEAVRNHLKKGLPLPDAVFCSGDTLALGAIQAFEEAGVSIPDEVSIIGSSGIDSEGHSHSMLTRVSHDLEGIGREVVRMALRRLAYPGLALAGVYMPTRFIGGGTTRPQENELLGIAPRPHSRF